MITLHQYLESIQSKNIVIQLTISEKLENWCTEHHVFLPVKRLRKSDFLFVPLYNTFSFKQYGDAFYDSYWTNTMKEENITDPFLDILKNKPIKEITANTFEYGIAYLCINL